MADIFNLFDGSFDAGGAGSSTSQNATLSPITPENDLLARLASGSDGIDLLVDYTDFKNFVTFNSAFSYVTVTADAILNSYPFGGSAAEHQLFLDSIDGYQRYFLANWPSWTGHLRLTPAVSPSYALVTDFGVDSGAARSSFLSPGTGSISFQSWIDVPILTGTNDAMVLVQKQLSNGDGLTVYFTGSQARFQINSGSSSIEVSGTLTENPSFISMVCDRTSQTGSVSVYIGTTGTFPALADNASLGFFGRLDLGSGSFSIASGSLSGKNTIAFTGSIDDLSVWSIPRDLIPLTSSYIRKTFAQPGLLASWRFDEASVRSPSSFGSVIRDSSGHRLDGKLQNFFSGSRGTGSLSRVSPDPILSVDDPDVYSYIVSAQQSGTSYDRGNQSMFSNLFPADFTEGETGQVFSNFVLPIARHFDRIKTAIDQLVYLNRVKFGTTDQAPDDLLELVGEFQGWTLDGSFVDSDVLKYFLGLSVSPNNGSGIQLDQKLSQIKASFWRRVLQNVMYLHKTRGTRESVEALLRAYGVDNGFVRLKEYARRTEARPLLERVESEKSVYALQFLSASSVSLVQNGGLVTGSGDPLTIEVRVSFPAPTNTIIAPTELSGTIWTLRSGSTDQSLRLQLWYEKSAASSMTGNVYLSSSAGRVQLVSAPIFDGNFYGLTVVRERVTGSITLSANRYSEGELVYTTSSFALTGSIGFPRDAIYPCFEVGSSVLTASNGQWWGQEVRLWNKALNNEEILDHAANFESYGCASSFDNRELQVHWRLNDGGAVDGSGKVSVIDSTPAGLTGSGIGYAVGKVPFNKFLEDYTYIPSIDYGWNQKKVRLFSGSSISPFDEYQDERFVSLELNMVDALNEDISHLMTSYDELVQFIGLPVNRYRESYQGLGQMRETYFKRLQGNLNFRVFADMLDFFDRSFVKIVQRLLPARSVFKGDEFIVESHMLERPKYQYGLRPIIDGLIDVSGTIAVGDRYEDTW